MSRTRIIATLLISAAAMFAASASQAAPISANNPYRSFNISGYNYGSTTWEKQHKSSSRTSHGLLGGLFRHR